LSVFAAHHVIALGQHRWREHEGRGYWRDDTWVEHPEDRANTRAEVARLAAGSSSWMFENRFRTRSGDYRLLSWTAVHFEDALYCVARDITEEREQAAALTEAQERLRQAQKMETVGQLTGGVAHDFNNLLQIVTGNLEILLRNLGSEQPRLRRVADNAMNGAKRAAILTQRLLAFSRRQPLAPKPIDVNKLVPGMSELLHRTLGETIEVETVLASGLWRVEADPNQLETALLNLAVNARDAMPDGGKLTIETSNTLLDRSYAAQNVEVAPGQYMMICVTDTGAGMGPATISRAFEPFFTTKEVGKGTGLGLSMVYGFVKQSGGNVKIYSEVGEGTTVKIYLPRLLGALPDEEDAPAAIIPEGAREETILVCEDDDDVRAYSVEVLRDLGYRVLEAHDGPSALRLLERQEGRVDLLFTDVVLPSGMTGAVLAEKARALRPELKVLFTTGYARNAIVHQGRLDPGVELITKPFAYSELASRIRDLLDSSR
jgi:signal transduction histidine kinase